MLVQRRSCERWSSPDAVLLELADELANHAVPHADLLLELLQGGLVDLALVDLRLRALRPGFCDFQLFKLSPDDAHLPCGRRCSSFEMSSGCPGDTACLNGLRMP